MTLRAGLWHTLLMLLLPFMVLGGAACFLFVLLCELGHLTTTTPTPDVQWPTAP